MTAGLSMSLTWSDPAVQAHGQLSYFTVVKGSLAWVKLLLMMAMANFRMASSDWASILSGSSVGLW
jgi:hypothetical protein